MSEFLPVVCLKPIAVCVRCGHVPDQVILTKFSPCLNCLNYVPWLGCIECGAVYTLLHEISDGKVCVSYKPLTAITPEEEPVGPTPLEPNPGQE